VRGRWRVLNLAGGAVVLKRSVDVVIPARDLKLLWLYCAGMIAVSCAAHCNPGALVPIRR
jgi:hypothetical protein